MEAPLKAKGHEKIVFAWNLAARTVNRKKLQIRQYVISVTPTVTRIKTPTLSRRRQRRTHTTILPFVRLQRLLITLKETFQHLSQHVAFFSLATWTCQPSLCVRKKFSCAAFLVPSQTPPTLPDVCFHSFFQTGVFPTRTFYAPVQIKQNFLQHTVFSKQKITSPAVPFRFDSQDVFLDQTSSSTSVAKIFLHHGLVFLHLIMHFGRRLSSLFLGCFFPTMRAKIFYLPSNHRLGNLLWVFCVIPSWRFPSIFQLSLLLTGTHTKLWPSRYREYPERFRHQIKASPLADTPFSWHISWTCNSSSKHTTLVDAYLFLFFCAQRFIVIKQSATDWPWTVWNKFSAGINCGTRTSQHTQQKHIEKCDAKQTRWRR